jgi:hypothetical protein
MQRSFQDLFPNVQVTPARAAAFGAAIGGLAALMVLRVAGEAVADAAAPMPAYGLVIAAEVVGAAVAWAKARRHTAR